MNPIAPPRFWVKPFLACSLIGLTLSNGLFTLPLTAYAEGETFWGSHNTYEKQITRIGRRLLEANQIGETISFRVRYRTLQDSNNVNANANEAFGRVSVESGLLRYVESDDELAGILGHEVAHILLRHGSKLRLPEGIMSAMVIAAAASGAATGNAVYLPPGNSVAFQSPLVNVMVRKQEMAADLFGLDLMMKAGYNPEAMLSIYQKIMGDGTTWQFLRSHPMGRDRLKALKVAIANKQAATGSTAPASSSGASSPNVTPTPTVSTSPATTSQPPATSVPTTQREEPGGGNGRVEENDVEWDD